jgi:hypothetical protein
MRTIRLTAALATAATLIALGATAPQALASHNQLAFFEAPGNLLGVPATYQQKTLTQLQSLGVRALRVTLFWRNVAPKPNHKRRPRFNQANPAAYDWGEYDLLINRAVAMHWTVLLTVTGPVPRWATPHGEDRYSYPNTTDFEQFMQAVGRRYGRQVKLFSIWNEPNQPGFLRPQYVHGALTSPEVYRGLYIAGRLGLQNSGNFTHMKVLLGETSAVGIGTHEVPAPLAFMRSLLCLDRRYRPVGSCAKLPADGWAQHPYANSRGPFGDPPADDVTIGTLGRLVTALDNAARAGRIRTNLPIYITEFGVQSYPNPVVGVPLAKQAEFDAIGERIAWDNSRVASFSQYLLQDDHPRGGLVVGFQSGLETYKGARKPSYEGFRLPLTVTQTSRQGVSFWGHVRPARGAARVILQYSSNGGRSWHALATEQADSSGYWSGHGHFERGRVWRATWIAPGGRRFFGAPIRAYTVSGALAQ